MNIWCRRYDFVCRLMNNHFYIFLNTLNILNTGYCIFTRRKYIAGMIKHCMCNNDYFRTGHNDVIKWKHFPRYWPFVRGIHRSPVNSLHKDQWRGALTFSLIWIWTNGWVHKREPGDLRRHRAHDDVTAMSYILIGPHAFCFKNVSFCKPCLLNKTSLVRH